MRLKKALYLGFFLLFQWIFVVQVFGAESITLTSEPNNAILRGEKIKYVLKQEALVDPTLPLYIRITFSEGLTVQNDSISYRTTTDGIVSDPIKFNNKQIIYGSDGFTILLDAPVQTTAIQFTAEVEKIASETVSCIANFLSSKENIQVTQKIHDLKFSDVPLDGKTKPSKGKITASALQKNEVRPVNTRKIFYYFFLSIGGLFLILLVLGVYSHFKNKRVDSSNTDLGDTNLDHDEVDS